METTQRSNWGIVLLMVALLLGLFLALAMPRELPTLERVRHGAHAEAKHGEDARAALAGLENCGDGLRVRLCPPGSKYGLTVCFWCETGTGLCPGMYTTIGGTEKTRFIRPCEDWRQCR